MLDWTEMKNIENIAEVLEIPPPEAGYQCSMNANYSFSNKHQTFTPEV